MKNKVLCAAASVLLLAAAAPLASTGDWLSLGVDGRGNAWDINKALLARDQEAVLSWKRVRFAEPRPRFQNRTPVASALVLEATHCDQGQVSVRAIKFLDANEAVIAAYDSDEHPIQWPFTKPRHLVDNALAVACAYRPE